MIDLVHLPPAPDTADALLTPAQKAVLGDMPRYRSTYNYHTRLASVTVPVRLRDAITLSKMRLGDPIFGMWKRSDMLNSPNHLCMVAVYSLINTHRYFCAVIAPTPKGTQPINDGAKLRPIGVSSTRVHACSMRLFFFAATDPTPDAP